MTALPKYLPIESLCEDVNVGHVGSSSGHRQDDGIPFLMGKNVGPGYLKLDALERVTPAFHLEQRKSQLRAGDIVVVRIGNSGQAARIPTELGEANCSGLVIIKQPHGIDPDFLVYYLNSPRGRAYSMSKAGGSTRQTLNTRTVAETLVPIPAATEQRRIVEKLDLAMDLLGRAGDIARTRKCLTDSLLASAMDSRLGPTSASSAVGEVQLSEVARIINGRAYAKDELLASGTYRVLRVGNFFTNSSWYWSSMELDPDKYCESGDLLYAWSASFGPQIWRGEKSIFHYHIWKIEEDRERVDRRWLYWWLRWDVDQIKAASGTGSTMMHVTKGSMEARRLWLPTKQRQVEVAWELDRVQAAIDQISELDRTRASLVRELQGSILAAAFDEVMS